MTDVGTAPYAAALSDLVDTANALADAASVETLRHFRANGLNADNKAGAGDFDPVTIADRGAERAMREVLAIRRPDDGIFGEEEARTIGRSGLTWVLDPIDGTRAFISGLPLWGTLIALDDATRGRIGIIEQPYLGERYIGIMGDSGSVAQLISRAGTHPLRTRACTDIASATVFTTDPFLFTGGEVDAFTDVRERARLVRYGTDCYAYGLLAMGQIDLVIEAGLQAYDIAAHVPLITAAGGIVTDWQGGDCRWGGRTVAAGDPAVHAAALEILSRVD